nr:helix-turn-helix transcriptional regulator [Streptomyces indicus]
MDEHAHTAIGLAEIAEAAHVTPRALQYAFRRHLGQTPMEYLRSVRLHRAHAELRNAVPAAGVTVTAIATAWGFGHPGRFAAAYRRTFGCSPSDTLKRPPEGPDLPRLFP